MAAKKKPAPAKKPAPVKKSPVAAKPAPVAKGRPPGSPNITAVVTVIPSRCQKCQSTERTPYTNATDRPYGGLTADGQPYTNIVWRSTTCASCGQARRDRCFEYRPEAAAEK